MSVITSGYCKYGEHSNCLIPSCECECHHSKPNDQAPARRVIDNFVWHPSGLFTMSGHEGLDARELSFLMSRFQATALNPDCRAYSLPVMPTIGMPGDSNAMIEMRIVSFRRVQPIQLHIEIPWDMEREVI